MVMDLRLKKKGRFSYRAEIDGTEYILRFKYNSTSESWTLDIDDVVYGIRLFHGVSLIERFQYLDVPRGILLFFAELGFSWDEVGNGDGNGVGYFFSERDIYEAF